MTYVIRPRRGEPASLSSHLSAGSGGERGFFPAAMGEPILVKRAAAAIDRRWPDAEGLEPEADPELILSELDRRLRTRDWHGYTWADLQRAARALFGPLQQHGHRAGAAPQRHYVRPAFHHLVDFLIGQVAPGAMRRFARTMYHLYLATFEATGAHTRTLATRLERHHSELGLSIDDAARLGVLSPQTAVESIADRMTQEASPYEFLKRTGIAAPYGEGLMARVHREFVTKHSAAEIRRNPAASERLLNWIVPPLEGASPMDSGAELGVNALLEPWKEDEPAEALRERLRDELLRGFGDPRLTQAGAWTRCSNDALAVIRRWLAQVTIETFFQIISNVVTSHMWGDRKDLWLDRVSRREITDAWFALSPRGVQEANRLRRQGGTVLEHGTNTSGSSQDRDKCLLLMKVNGRIVVEGSHSFKTHIYRRGDSQSVRFHRRSYTCQQFRDDATKRRAQAIIHHKNWAYKVRNVLDG